jgi:hypothetical protein
VRVSAAVALSALVAGIATPWAVANTAIESLGAGGWLVGSTFVAVAIAAPVAVSLNLARDAAIPTFARVLGPAQQRSCIVIAWVSCVVLIVTTVMAIGVALGLVFDPRYRDFPFAPLTAAVVPFVVASFAGRRSNARRGSARRGTAETVAAVTLAGSAVYIVLNEGFANWQALWLAAALIALAVTLLRLRDVQST